MSRFPLHFALVIVLGLIYPSMMANERATKINRELPFALRQLATQIKAGVSFHKALSSLVSAHYGALSEEFGKIQQDMYAIGVNHASGGFITLAKNWFPCSEAGLDAASEFIMLRYGWIGK